MTATNHVLTGALIGALVSNPVIALPLAFASHFVFDSVPHFGVDPEKSPIFKPALLIDITLASLVLLVTLTTQPANFWLLIACSITAASPDLLSIAFFIDILRHREHKFGIVQRILRKIQWSETVFPGLLIEASWFVLIGAILVQRLY